MDDKYVSNTFLNEQLKNYILNGISICNTKLEKAIYVYIKLCQTFSYNNEYYIFDGGRIVAYKHETIDNIPKYNMVNNQIICYEFTAIFAKFLDILGINFKVKYKKEIDHFGGQHTNLTFYEDDFIIYTDSVTSILDGDLFRSKIGLDLVGIVCKNESEIIKCKFNSVLNNVYLKLNDKSYLNYFNELKSKIDNIDLVKKIDLFSKLSNMMFSSCMDKLSLMLYFKRTMLNEEEKDQCTMLIVKDNCKELKYTNIYHNQLAFPVMIILINDNPFVFVPGNNLIKLSINELQNMFDTNILEYKIDNPKRLTIIKNKEK